MCAYVITKVQQELVAPSVTPNLDRSFNHLTSFSPVIPQKKYILGRDGKELGTFREGPEREGCSVSNFIPCLAWDVRSLDENPMHGHAYHPHQTRGIGGSDVVSA
jgi:hypothetical protein